MSINWTWLVYVACFAVVLAVADMNLDKALGLQGIKQSIGVCPESKLSPVLYYIGHSNNPKNSDKI